VNNLIRAFLPLAAGLNLHHFGLIEPRVKEIMRVGCVRGLGDVIDGLSIWFGRLEQISGTI
jgi:hypothetical protein